MMKDIINLEEKDREKTMQTISCLNVCTLNIFFIVSCVCAAEQKNMEAEEDQINEPDSNVMSQEILKQEGPPKEVCNSVQTMNCFASTALYFVLNVPSLLLC